MSDQHIIPNLNHPSNQSEIDHSSELASSIGDLLYNQDFSDIVLEVDGQTFFVHKVVLAARSEYFRALLFGGMKESSSQQIVLKDISAVAFKYILMYVYTGKMNLGELKEETILDILGLAHQYNFRSLESSVSNHLRQTLDTDNICLIYNIAILYNLEPLITACLQYLDRNAEEFLQHDSFRHLSLSAVERLIKRDSFCAPEVDIFHGVLRWLETVLPPASTPTNLTSSQTELKIESSSSALCGPDDPRSVMTYIRFALMRLEDLLEIVRPSGMVSSDTILDAIAVRSRSRDSELPYRGLLLPGENMATTRLGCQVIRGDRKTELLNGDPQAYYDSDRGFTRHAIDDPHGQIVIQLGKSSIINTIRILLWDKDLRSYSYYVEVSIDDKDYVRVVDYRTYLCRSMQLLHFPPRVVRYIRLVGTHNSVNRIFHVVALQCLYSDEKFGLHKGLVVPTANVATIQRHATVVEGVSRTRNALINGDTKNYDWDSGYTCHQLGNGAIVVQLAQPYFIGSMRFLLWDLDDRAYSYTVEVSTDQTIWQLVCDRSQEPCRSWQTVLFSPRPITFIRIIGTHNTANEVFHVVHFECPYDGDNNTTILDTGSPDSSVADDQQTPAGSVETVVPRPLSPLSTSPQPLASPSYEWPPGYCT